MSVIDEVLLSLSGYIGDFSNEEITFFHPSEKEIVTKLSTIGKHYTTLRHQVTQCQQVCNSLTPHNNLIPSLYLESICKSITVYLDKYLSDIIEIEKVVDRSSDIRLTFLYVKLKDYTVIFTGLLSLLKQLVDDSMLRSGILINFLYAKITKSRVLLRRVLENVLEGVNGVFIESVVSWMIFGERNDEFFVAKGGEGYEVRIQQLPLFVDIKLAEKILFVGEVVHKVMDRKLFDDSELKVFMEELSNADRHNLRYVVSKIYDQVSKRLWRFMQGDCLGFLNKIKEYFLLSNGVLFHSFVNNVLKFYRNSSEYGNSNDINNIFIYTLKEEHQYTEEIEDLFSIISDVTDDERSFSKLNVELKLNMINCNNYLSLKLFFTKQIIEKYQKMFKLLFYVKTIQISLNASWKKIVKFKNYSKKIIIIANLRQKMEFFMNTLIFYFYNDIIEINFRQLLKKINNTKNQFESVKFDHDVFLSNLMSECFLDIDEIKDNLNRTLHTCKLFTDVILLSNNLESIESTSKINNLSVEFEKNRLMFMKMLSGFLTNPYVNKLLLKMNYNEQY